MTSNNDGFYVMAFHSVSHSIQTEKSAREIFNFTVVPTPRELANDCGIAIKFNNCDFTEIEAFHGLLKIPADVYFITNERINGKREVKKLL